MFINAQLPILEPQGCINRSTAKGFEAEVLATLAQNHPSALVIDMSQVESLDSHGLMALVSSLNAAQRRNCALMLCRVPPGVRIILEVSQLDQVFDIREDRPAIAPLAA